MASGSEKLDQQDAGEGVAAGAASGDAGGNAGTETGGDGSAETNAEGGVGEVTGDGATPAAIDWQARAADLEAELSTVSAQLASVSDELADAIAKRDALQAAADAAAAVPRSRASTGSVKLRKVADVDNPSTEDLMAAIAAAGTVELLFTDGAREISGMPARVIEGAAWQVSIIGVALALPQLIVTGPGPQIIELKGYALFLDGKQAAWAARPDVLRIAPGATMNLAGDVVFAAA